MMIRFLIVAAGAVIAAGSPARADALLQHPVLRTYQPMRIALPDFVATSPSESEPARVISQIIASDLEQSGIFARIDPATFAGKNASIDELPGFADWRGIKAQELLIGRVAREADGRIQVQFRLYDVFSGQQIAGQQYTGDPDEIDRVGHMISADIYVRTKGK